MLNMTLWESFVKAGTEWRRTADKTDTLTIIVNLMSCFDAPAELLLGIVSVIAHGRCVGRA